jgi:hypothetical protein
MLATYPHLLSIDSLAFARCLEKEIGFSLGKNRDFYLNCHKPRKNRRSPAAVAQFLLTLGGADRQWGIILYSYTNLS